MKKGKNQLVDGVCSGISEQLGLKDPIWVRLLFVFGGSIFFTVYIVLMFLMEEPDEN